jgi:hypothetical protein
MPVLKYFAVVGLALVSLLFVANSLLSRPENPIYAAKFDRAPIGLQRGSVMTSQLAPEPPHIATVPSEPAATAAPIASAKAASTPAGKEPAAEQAKEPAQQEAAQKAAEAAPVKTAREQPVKKRQRTARKHARPQPWQEAERGDRWERQDRAERQDRQGRRQDGWGRPPWDDAFAFAPRNRDRDPFWFR